MKELITISGWIVAVVAFVCLMATISSPAPSDTSLECVSLKPRPKSSKMSELPHADHLHDHTLIMIVQDGGNYTITLKQLREALDTE